ncbi:MAG: hypothetical protein GC180_08755 [Bacteroidetes bacterium]|nr:hypothetical protein [Bacteroidota bacterium]
MYKYIRHLSLDVAIGAAVMMAFTASFLEVHVDGVYYFLLSLTTWLIYTADHLMDAKNIPHEANTPRHRFHQIHFKMILSAAIVGVFGFILVVPRDTGVTLFRLAVGLSGFILLYFLSLIWARKTQFRYVLKEVFIAACYTFGVSFIPVHHAWPLDLSQYFFLFLIFTLALSNLFIFSMREMKPDFQDANPSAIRFMGLQVLKTLIQIILILHLAASLFLLSEGYWPFAILFMVMNLTLQMLYYFPEKFGKREWYRVLGDGIFLFPLIWLVVDYIF